MKQHQSAIALSVIALLLGMLCAEALACPACDKKNQVPVEVCLKAKDVSLFNYLMDEGLEERSFPDSDIIVEKDLSEKLATIIVQEKLVPCDLELLDDLIEIHDAILPTTLPDPVARLQVQGVIKHLTLLKAQLKICIGKASCITCHKHPCACTPSACCGKCSTPQCTCGGKEPKCCPTPNTVGGRVGNFSIPSCRGTIVNGGTEVQGTGDLGSQYASIVLQQGQQYGNIQHQAALNASLVPCAPAIPWCAGYRDGQTYYMPSTRASSGCSSCTGVPSTTVVGTTVVRHGVGRRCAAWSLVRVENAIYREPPNGVHWCDCPTHIASCRARGLVWQLVPCQCNGNCTRCGGGSGCGGQHASSRPHIINLEAILASEMTRRKRLQQTIA